MVESNPQRLKKQLSRQSSQGRVTAADFIGMSDGRLREHYRIGKVLGTGAFGEVRLCVHRESGSQRAVKVLRKQDMSDQSQRMLFNEIQVLKRIDHPNVVKLYEVFEDEKRYYLVTEICKGGELFDFIVSKGNFSEQDAALLMKQVISCVNYCHTENIVHRDLKPENILLEASCDFDSIKIIDFGTALEYQDGSILRDMMGTAYYMAPEVINERYNEKCDVWSCGIITYILLSGEPPFFGHTDQETFRKIRRGKFSFAKPVWNNVSEKAKDFITQMLTLDFDDRPSAGDCLNHPWLTELATQKVAKPIAKSALENLQNFRAEVALKQAVYAFIASQLLSKGDSDELAKVFKAIDRSGDGKLSFEELKEGYIEHFGNTVSDEEVQQICQRVDTNQTGFIDYSEFIVAAMQKNQLNSQEKLQAAFHIFDKDGSGIMNEQEIRSVLQYQGSNAESSEAYQAILKQVDENSDGEMSFEEFYVMMRSIN